MKKETYKNTLSQKSVEELVEIILRKDDKEKEKNKQISRLERRINHYKEYQKDIEEEFSNKRAEYSKLEQRMNCYKEVCDVYEHKLNVCKHQNIILRLIISVLGAVAIIEFLALIFS